MLLPLYMSRSWISAGDIIDVLKQVTLGSVEKSGSENGAGEDPFVLLTPNLDGGYL